MFDRRIRKAHPAVGATSHRIHGTSASPVKFLLVSGSTCHLPLVASIVLWSFSLQWLKDFFGQPAGATVAAFHGPNHGNGNGLVATATNKRARALQTGGHGVFRAEWNVVMQHWKTTGANAEFFEGGFHGAGGHCESVW